MMADEGPIWSDRDGLLDRALAAESALASATRELESLRSAAAKGEAENTELKRRLALKASVYTAEEMAADRESVLAWDFEKGQPR